VADQDPKRAGLTSGSREARGHVAVGRLRQGDHFTAFLNRIGTMTAKVPDWKELFWETAHHQKGDCLAHRERGITKQQRRRCAWWSRA
jgi:hypothetical protein